MSFDTAMTALAAVGVTGVTAHYAYTAAPADLGAVTLPILICFPTPAKLAEGALSDKATAKWEIETANASAGLTEYVVHDLLIYGALPTLVKSYEAPAALASLVQLYQLSIKADPRLGGTLFRPAAITVAGFPIVSYRGRPYLGARFNHKWTIEN